MMLTPRLTSLALRDGFTLDRVEIEAATFQLKRKKVSSLQPRCEVSAFSLKISLDLFLANHKPK